MNGPGSAGRRPGRRRGPDDPPHRARTGRVDDHGRRGGVRPDAGPAGADAASPAGPDAATARAKDSRTGEDAAAGAQVADAAPGAGDGQAGAGPARSTESGLRRAVAYFRANPQVFVLLVICLVLGLGTFLAILIALLTAGSVQTTGEPSGVVFGAHALTLAQRSLPL
jgi:hypothetical protein